MNLHHWVSLIGTVLILAAISATLVSLASPSWSRYESGSDRIDYNPYVTARLITGTASTNAVLSSLAMWIILVAKLYYMMCYLAIDTRIYSIKDHTLSAHDVVKTKIMLIFVIICDIGLVAYINNNVDYPGNTGYGVNLHTHTDSGYKWWLSSIVLAAVAPITTIFMAVTDKVFHGVITSHMATGGKKTKKT